MDMKARFMTTTIFTKGPAWTLLSSGMRNVGAIGKKQKRTILTQEGIRILRNTHPDLPDKYREEDMSAFAKKLQNSGYDEKERNIIIKSALNGYKKQVKADKDGIKPLY